MSRLPVPGKDIGTWGIILNDFLNQSHNADGSIKNNVVTPAALAGDIPQTKIENLQTDISSKANTSDLAPVATSGVYVDLTDKPTIPSTLSNLSDDSTHRLVTDTEKSTWDSKQNAMGSDDNYVTDTEKSNLHAPHSDDQDLSGKQDVIGFTPENVANKDTNTSLGSSDTKYPSQKAVKTYVDSSVAGLLDFRGTYDASGNAYPTTGGSGTAGAIMKGDMWVISVAGTLNSKTIHIGDYLIAIIDTPAQTNANWNTLDTNLGYTPEDSANKTITFVSPTDVKYPSAKLVSDQLDLKQNLSGKNVANGYVGLNASSKITEVYIPAIGTRFFEANLKTKFVYLYNNVNKFVDFTGVEGKGTISSTFNGVATRISYLGELFRFVRVWVTLEFAGYPLTCTIRKDDFTTILATATASPADCTNGAWVTFEFPTVIDSSVITEANFYIACGTTATTGCRMAIFSFGTPTARMSASTSFKNKWRAGTSWVDMSTYNANPLCIVFLNDDDYLINISYSNTTSGMVATTVQGAIDELKASMTSLPVDAVNVNGILLANYNVETFGTEKFVNPGFETWTGTFPTSWTCAEGGEGNVFAKETSIIHGGLNAVKMTHNGTLGYNPQAYQSFTVVPGELYELNFWTRGDGTNYGTYRVQDTTHVVAILNPTSTGVISTTWTKVTYRFTIPAACIAIYIMFNTQVIVGATAYFDDVSLKLVTTTNRNGLVTPLQSILSNFPAKAIKYNGGTLVATNTEDAILEAYNHAPSVSFSPRIIVPTEVAAVVGDKIQLFVRGMIEAQNPYFLPYQMFCSAGNSYPRYFEYTPVVGDVGTKVLTVEVRDLAYNVVTTQNMNIVVVNPTGSPATNKNVLCIGDSLSAGGVWEAEMYRRLTQAGGTPAGLSYSNITFLGDNPLPGYATQGFIGWGGWTWQSYTGGSGGHVLTGTFDKDKTDVGSSYTDGTNSWIIEYAVGGLKIHGAGTLAASGTLTHVSGGTHASNIVYTAKTDEPQSPLWDSATSEFSFTKWATRNSYSGLDEVYVLLGWNGLAQPNKYLASDHTATTIAAAKVFIDKLHIDYPSCKVRVMGIQIPSINGGLGYAYGAATGYAPYYSLLRSVNGLRLAYQAMCLEAGYSGFCTYIDNAIQVDSENNMPFAATAVNSRSATTENRGTNGVHPDTTGYYQIADACYRDFIRHRCSS